MERIIDNEDAYLNQEMAMRDQADEPEVDESEPTLPGEDGEEYE